MVNRQSSNPDQRNNNNNKKKKYILVLKRKFKSSLSRSNNSPKISRFNTKQVSACPTALVRGWTWRHTHTPSYKIGSTWWYPSTFLWTDIHAHRHTDNHRHFGNYNRKLQSEQHKFIHQSNGTTFLKTHKHARGRSELVEINQTFMCALLLTQLCMWKDMLCISDKANTTVCISTHGRKSKNDRHLFSVVVIKHFTDEHLLMEKWW